jgi:hypothetical protein
MAAVVVAVAVVVVVAVAAAVTAAAVGLLIGVEKGSRASLRSTRSKRGEQAAMHQVSSEEKWILQWQKTEFVVSPARIHG